METCASKYNVAFNNSLGLSLGSLLGGTAVVEIIYNWREWEVWQ